MRLSIILGTRNRPDLLRATVEKTLSNVVLPETRMLIAVDDDDSATAKVAMSFMDGRIAVSIKPREDTLGGKYNRVLKELPADVYLVMVDYAPIITQGFDKNIIEAAAIYPDGYACVVGPYANLSFPCTQAVTHKLAAVLGGIYPLYFPYWFIDHWLDDIVQMIDRKIYAEVISDFWSRRPGTMERREPGFWASFYDQMYHERAECALKVINALDFDETPARKKALPRNFTIIRQRSSMINEGVQQSNAAWDCGDRDERYDRIKADAVRVLDAARDGRINKSNVVRVLKTLTGAAQAALT